MKKIFFSSLLVLLTMVGIVPRLAAQEEGTPQYDVELLTNIPPAAANFTGWTTSGSVQCSEGWFKTSHTEGTISQTIDLSAHGYTPVAANTLFLTAAAEYHVGWAIGKQDGIAQMYVECLDADNNVLATDSVLNRTGKFGSVDPTRVCDMFSIPANTTQVRYVLVGQDQCHWSGYYGTWFRNMSCKVYDNTKFSESIQVSVAPELGDSLTLSKTSNFHYGDTITVSPTYPERPILWLTLNDGKVINTNQVVCLGENIVISAHLKYPHAIMLNGTHATLTADKIEAGMGDTVTLSYTLDENSYWGNYTTDINVTWINANSFIMPDAPVTVGNTAIVPKSLPYFEGFENGNTQDAVVADWLQQSENGTNSWVANTSYTGYNRAPYAGSWNATLYGSNTDWLFQAFTLEAGKEYTFSMRARSYYTAKILVKLGNQANKDAMSVTIVPETTLSKTDYQCIGDKFTVETTGTYVIGIRGYSTNSSNYTSIDNIQVREAQSHTITCTGTHATLTADKIEAGMGDTVTLSYTLDENSYWGNYTTDIDVTWVDANRFIMPDENVAVGNTVITVKSLPYFEGFENGNTQDAVLADWFQQSENGDYSWVANSTNTSFNRTPYAGSSWNATLHYSNTDWLFQALALEAGENYVLSLYARQDYENTSYANITAALGTACSKDSMTTILIPETGLTNGDYQLLTDTFQVAETKAYVLGIKGYINGTPYYISMDNIMVSQEVYPASIATPVGVDGFTEDAARTALATLSLTAQDSKDNTKCTITNLPENWVLDLENKKATYTAADSLLPVGYYCTDTITVDLVLNQYTLTINEASNGSITGTSGTYDYGTVITLTATPNEGCRFVQWSDGTTSATYTFTLTGDTTLTATFAIDQHTITVTAGEKGTVKMEVNDEETAETVFDYGTEITLTAIPDEGYYFVDWSDGSWTTPYVFTIKKDCELTANFALTQYGMELLSNIPPVAIDLKRWVATSETNDCVPICSEGWYKTGRYTGIISQTIDLAAKGYNMPIAENTLLLYAAAEYFVGWTSDAPGIAKVYVEFLDAENNVLSTNYVLNRTGQFGTVDITLVEDMFMVPANTTQVRYVLEGCDQCGWGGYFGTWFRNMSCKLLEATKIGNPINVSVAETLGDSLTLSKIADFRYGDTITVIPTYSQHPIIWLAVNEGRIINNNQVVCLGENIIISAELMSHKSVPYFEGFENGNAQDYKVAGWLLQSEQGDGNWSANNTGTSDNRSPYDGSWNATLSKGNTNWLFQALTLEADETYVLSLYARQTYSNTKAATITAALGDAFNKEAMTDTLITETGVNATYKQLTDTFQVSESKVYVLGIRGYISMSSWALAMDNIMVEQKVYPATITTPLGLDDLTEDAARTALATLSLTAVDTKGNTKCAITNLPENWVLDLENKKATYSVVRNLLPKGYYSDEVTITVTFIQNTPTQLSETNAETKVEKVLRNGQVFIIRNGNTYDLTGRKAE